MPRTTNTQTNTENQQISGASTSMPESNAEASTLQVQDLQNLLHIVDYAAEQGAFKGWSTISQVFAVRQKLHAFLQTVVSKTEASEQNAEGENLEKGAAPPASSKEEETKLHKKKRG